MDAILGDPDSPFYLGRAATVHLLLGGEDYPDLADRIRTRSGRVLRRTTATRSSTRSADSLRSLPRIFVERRAAAPPGPRAPGSRPGRGCSTSGAAPAGRSWSWRSGSRRAVSTAPTSNRARSSWPRTGSPRTGLADRCDGAAARPRGPDRRRHVRRHHDVPRRPRDRARTEGRRHRLGCASADARWLARDLRRGLPRHRRGDAHDAEPVHRRRPVVRVDVGQPDRHGRGRCERGCAKAGLR